MKSNKPKKLRGVQQNLLSPDSELQAILEYLCSESNKLHNCAVYHARQIYFKAKKYVSKFDLAYEMVATKNRHFQALYSQASQATCHAVGESVESFKQLLSCFYKGGIKVKPKFPDYRKPGYQVVSYPSQALKLKEGMIRFPLGRQVKAWFGLSEFFLPKPANLKWILVKEVRFLPRNGAFYVEYVYLTDKVKADVDPARAIGIDHGLNNWITAVSNVGTSFIVDGLHLKSINQWYNKSVARLMADKPNGYWSERLARLTEKRNRVIRDAVNKAARLILNHCLDNRIGTVVFGWNKGQKDGTNMGSKTNQQFVQIPTARLKERVKQLCEQHGISFVETEESYTSQASFIDDDTIPQYGEKPAGWAASGKRVKRGLYRSSNGLRINADCNGAANILRKVAMMLGLDLSGISRGELTAPLKFRLWTLQEPTSL